ncbi:hypothetical protein D3C81_1048520 [compost metagenome]
MTRADNGDENHIGQQAANKTQGNQRWQHRPFQGFGAAGDQRGKSRHCNRVGLGIGQAKHDAVPERLAYRALLALAITRTAAQCAQAQPEQVQAAEQTEDVEHRAADLAGTDNRHQCRAAPQHIAQQMTAEETGPGLAPARRANAQHREHARPRGDAIDKSGSQHGKQQRESHRRLDPERGRKGRSLRQPQAAGQMLNSPAPRGSALRSAPAVWRSNAGAGRCDW